MRAHTKHAGGGWKRQLIWAAALVIVAGFSVAANTDFSSPPRFDGAGYAVLAESLASGRGYREIASPLAVRHAHFPPGYPATLAFLWTMTGRSAYVGHLFSCACTVASVLLGWRWFGRLYPPRTAFLLGLALASNWTWGRSGGGIQSEPLYFLVSLLSVHALTGTAQRGGIALACFTGLVLGATMLTRHVGAPLVAAGIIHLLMHRRWKEAVSAGCVATLVVVPWAAWMARVGHGTQPELLLRERLPALVTRQFVFYLQRIPDQLTGPVVEIGTVFARSPSAAVLVNLWAASATGLITVGWICAVRSGRRRLAGLIPLASLGLLLAWPFTEAGRFLIPLVPFLLAGALEGLARIMKLATLRRARRWAAAALLVAAIPYSAYSIATGRAEALRHTYRNYDDACGWIAREGKRDGPVLARHPGEVYWLTGRQSLSPSSEDPSDNDRLVDKFDISYIVIDDDRYANAPVSALRRYVDRFPERVRPVWISRGPGSIVSVFEVRPRR